MGRSSYLRFLCPSCGTKLAGIEPMDAATQVVTRTCPACKDRWQLVVARLGAQRDGMRLDKATITFRDNARTRKAVR